MGNCKVYFNDYQCLFSIHTFKIDVSTQTTHLTFAIYLRNVALNKPYKLCVYIFWCNITPNIIHNCYSGNIISYKCFSIFMNLMLCTSCMPGSHILEYHCICATCCRRVLGWVFPYLGMVGRFRGDDLDFGIFNLIGSLF